MASDWSVAIFGDSWVAYSHPTWPQVLARRLGAQCHNFAFPGALSAHLPQQAQQAALSQNMPRAPGGLFRKETLVIVHTGGNDFISKMAQVIMGGGVSEILRPEPGKQEADNINQLLEIMYQNGARNFLVSGVPAFIHLPIFNMIWGIITNLVNSGQLSELGISPGDPPSLPMEVQACALNDRWENMCDAFSSRHSDANCQFFNEVDALHSLRAKLGEAVFDGSMWDFSMFHPTVYGHEQIADEALKEVLQHFPAASSAHVPTGAPAAKGTGKGNGANGYASVQAHIAAATGLPPPVAESIAEPKVENGTTSSSAKQDPTQQKKDGEPITLQLRNVKGDMSFSVSCSASSTVGELRVAALEAAPADQKQPNTVATLVYKGKVLQDSANIADLGIGDGAMVVILLKNPKPSA